MTGTSPSEQTAPHGTRTTANRRGNVLWFVIGVVAATAICISVFLLNASKSSGAEQSTIESSLHKTISRLQMENAQLNTSNQNMTAQVNVCTAKFARGTFIYDVGLLGTETRVWYIPADVEPVAIGTKRGSYSHYDPKAQTETVHLQPKNQ